MTPVLEYLDTVGLAVDTTQLQWAVDADGLRVRGTIWERGITYPVEGDAPWPVPQPRQLIRWFWVWRPDHSHGFMTADERNSATYPYRADLELQIAHGWWADDAYTESWEPVVWVLRCRRVSNLSGVALVHHLTDHLGNHWTYTPRAGQVLVRPGRGTSPTPTTPTPAPPIP